jgi:hypothetical protein
MAASASMGRGGVFDGPLWEDLLALRVPAGYRDGLALAYAAARSKQPNVSEERSTKVPGMGQLRTVSALGGA